MGSCVAIRVAIQNCVERKISSCGTCSKEIDGEGGLHCIFCQRRESTKVQRTAAKRKLQHQADRMLDKSAKRLQEAKVGDNATIPVSELDRGRADHRNIMTVIVSVDEKGFFRLGTRFGLLKTLFLRSMFQLCTDSGFIALDDVPLDKEISTREAATKESVGGGQGFSRCDCKSNCLNMRCKCRKENRLCNSKCHKSSACCNKVRKHELFYA